MSENVTLDEIMGNTQPSTTFIDITAPSKPVSPNPSVAKKVTAIQGGPIDMTSIKPIDVDSILPKRQQTPSAMENQLMADLDAAVERECESITERMNAIAELQREEAKAEARAAEDEEQRAEDDFAVNGTTADSSYFNDEYGYDEDEETPTTSSYDPARDSTASHFIPTVEEKAESNIDDANPIIAAPRSAANDNLNILDNVKDEELFDEEDDAAPSKDDVDTEELLNDLKKQIKEKVSPIRKTFDLSKFTIAQKAVSAQKVMKLAIKNHQNIADWVLFSANRPISVTGLSGPEILKLNPNNTNRNRLNTFRDMYRIIYDHIYDGNKPEFEAWLKQTRFIDLQHVYFALYMATFGGSNFINYSCDKCKKVFIKDIEFKDMVSYVDEETRSKVRNILKMDTTSPSSDTYPVDLVQISNSYVFALRTPSVWNIIIETASLSDQFLEKHADLIDMTAYIDAIYVIDEENATLIPVDTKPDPNDQAKTAGRRIKAFYDIIRSLSSEEYFTLRNKISDYDVDANKITYKIPACTCPHCSAKIPENTEISPDGMLFTRHQLAAIGSM